MVPAATRRKSSIVLHQEHSSPGKLGQMLTAKGFALDIRKPRFGEPLPETMDEHAGAIIFGGPMSANDPDDFIKAETDWIGVTLKEGAPFLGVCLGAQMLVKHLGGNVTGHCDGCAEIGFYQLACDGGGPEARRVAGHGLPVAPRGLRPADGRDAACARRHFREPGFLGRTALPSASSSTASSPTPWPAAGRCAARSASTCRWRKARPEHMAGWFRYDPAIRAWLWTFLDTWLAQDKRGLREQRAA